MAAGPASAQAFTLTVNQAPGITSARRGTFRAGHRRTFTIVTTGFPRPRLSERVGSRRRQVRGARQWHSGTDRSSGQGGRGAHLRSQDQREERGGSAPADLPAHRSPSQVRPGLAAREVAVFGPRHGQYAYAPGTELREASANAGCAACAALLHGTATTGSRRPIALDEDVRAPVCRRSRRPTC